MERITDVLSREHEDIFHQLEVCAKAIEDYDPEVIRGTRDFFRDQVGLHRLKEEDVLFPEVELHFPAGNSPMDALLEDHRKEEYHLAELDKALDQGDRQAIVDHASAIVELLPGHIKAEETDLFPLAERLLDAEARDRVLAGFAAIGSWV